MNLKMGRSTRAYILENGRRLVIRDRAVQVEFATGLWTAIVVNSLADVDEFIKVNGLESMDLEIADREVA